MGHAKAELKNLALRSRDAEARARGRGLSPVPPTPPINQPPPAPQQNHNPTAAPAVVDIQQGYLEPKIMDASQQIKIWSSNLLSDYLANSY